MAESALGSLLAGVTGAMAPLRTAFADPVKLSALLRELDGELTFDPEGLSAQLESGALRQLGDTIADAVDDGAAAIGDLDGSDAEQVAAVAELIEVVARLVAAIDELPDTLMGLDHDALGLPAHARTAAYWRDEIAGPLASRLLADRLGHRLPALYQLLVVLGAIDETDPARRMSLAALGDALADPAATLQALAGWGSASVDGDWITSAIADLAGAAGLPARIVTPPVEAVELAGGVASEARAVEVPIASGLVGTALVEAGLLVLPTGNGIALTNLTWGSLNGAVDLADPWTATVSGDLQATAAAGLLLRPSGVTALEGGGGGELALTLAGEPDDPWLLFGTPTSTRLELARVETGVTLVFDGDAAATLHVTLGGGNLVVVAGDALSRVILGTEQIEVPFDLDARWSSATGFTIGGALGLVFVIPVDRTLGFVTLRSIELSIGISDGGLAVGAGVALDGALGPFAVTAEGLGLELALVDAPDGDGMLGPFDAALSLLPPHRIGLSLEAEAVKGGGVIDLDPANGRYSGAVTLDFLAIGIDAMGVIDTRLPGDPDGWALFASLTARFPGLPLGFGFTLLGLGGILAVNRSIDAEALAAGLREGAVDALLFPDDPVRDAALILSQIDEYFPLTDGNTVIGPVAKIGWGAPTLITGELGIVLSLPQGVVVILGSLEALLPYPDAPVLELRMDTLGVIDVLGGTVLVTASLYDSRLLGVIELSGDMALYMSVLDDPFFLLSIGGFHPGYDPPASVPAVVEDLRQMRAEIVLGPAVTATLTSYFAATSNSIQFGGGFDITATVEFLLVDYTASGWFDFDVLVEFDPFRIVADLAAGVCVSAGQKELFGIDLEVHVEGPDPWYASCHARFKFFLINVKFDFTVGGHALPDAPESEDVLALMDAQLDLPAAWSVVTPTGVVAGVVLRDDQASSLLRPDSKIVVKQTIAPLDRDLDAYGNCTPEQKRISVAASGIRDGAGVPLGGVASTVEQDWFAPSQYSVMRDEQRLSAPNYERMDAGVAFGAEGVRVPTRTRDQILAPEGHETKLWEPQTGTEHTYDGLIVAMGVDAMATVRATTAGTTARAARGLAVALEPMTLEQTRYVVVDGVDGTVVAEQELDYVAAVRAAGGGERAVPVHAGAAA